VLARGIRPAVRRSVGDLRILIATPDFPPARGGIQLLLERLASHLARHQVLVVAPHQEGAAEVDRKLRYDVCRVQAPGGRQAALVALNGRLPWVAQRFRPDVIVSGHLICAPGALLARRALGTPVVAYVHAKELGHRTWFPRTMLPRANQVITVSDYARRLALAAGVNRHRITLVHPGVDPPPPAVSSGEPLVLTVARLQDRYKGFDVMLRAMPLVLARLPEARWVLVGDGPLRAELESSVRRADLTSSVVFTGAVEDDERDGWLARAGVFAMPSRVPARGAGEGFGIVFLEAGRWGVPSVTGNEGGAAEAVIDDVTGIHVDPRDHVAVADAISRLLEDDELRARYGAAARERAAQLSWAEMARAVEQVLESVLDARRR
jgi:phosphatidyl-myo-inositol dimannoside synthase